MLPGQADCSKSSHGVRRNRCDVFPIRWANCCTKWPTRSGRSSGAPATGHGHRKDVDAIEQVSAELLCVDQPGQIRFVATISRASVRRCARCRGAQIPVLAAPGAVSGCTLKGSSPISSRNTVPRFASSKRPMRWCNSTRKSPFLRVRRGSLSSRPTEWPRS